ncbi:MAG: thermonuclease family protein [Candidatus Bathyarchaeota archaeon]|nr:thermonuclease family protein [Candidatus Bathyarchaeota archaeon]
MAESPMYVGTKTGEVIKAIVINSIYTWRRIQKATGFSEKELNYHLHLLFNENVLVKERNEYYIIPELEEQYLSYYQPKPQKPMETHSEPPPDTLPSQITPKFSFLNLKGIVLISVLLFSLVLNLSNYQQITDLKAQNSALIAEIETYQESLEDLQSEIESLETQLEDIQNDYDALSHLNDELSSIIGELEPTCSSTSTSTSSSSTSISSSTIYVEKRAYCSRIIDGDTIELSNGIRIRLADIDAPESYESGYTASTNALEDWVLGKTVCLDVDDFYETDSYGRYVCVVYVSTSSGYVNVNKALLDDGYVDLSNYYNEFNPNEWELYENVDTNRATSFTTSSSISDTSDSSSSSSDDSSSSSSSGGPYWASKNSNIYHKTSCYWAQQISSSNLIVFSSKSAAEGAGYRACKVCKP